MSAIAVSEVEVDICARFPQAKPQALIAGFRPTARYGTVSFGSYQPNAEYASQQQACQMLQHFAENPPQAKRRRLFGRLHKPKGMGFYLDGGFGVGKTHLLAATWHTFQGNKLLLSFAELLYTIGALGIHNAIEAFAGFELICIDEFELDDPGNTHMVSTFLTQLMPQGTHVVTTSNTQPGQLGQGRFNAEDFQRQIRGIAESFTMLSLDGPDYRQRGTALANPLSAQQLDALAQAQTRPYCRLSTRDLAHHLLRVHPAQFSHLLDGIETVILDDIAAMTDQNVALRFVHFIDKVYDLNLNFAASGVPLAKLFDDSFRFGAYQKKYSRCLSRLSEMLRAQQV